jgi:hypothetical protein
MNLVRRTIPAGIAPMLPSARLARMPDGTDPIAVSRVAGRGMSLR